MKLEGTLDAFSLPDIFQLLSFTKKTGALHLRREDEVGSDSRGGEQHGVVHLTTGLVTGARSDAARQALGRRLVGSGLVSDDALADAVEDLLEHPERGLGRALASTAGLDADLLRDLAREQATDAVFDLLRWPDGAFAFVVDEADPDDVGGTLSVEELVGEAQTRIESWSALKASVPTTTSVVLLSPRLDAPPALERDEWALLCLVDGTRTVADLVDLAGRGEYVVVKALAGLVDRGVVAIDEPAPGVTGTQRRQALLAALEGTPVPAAVASAPAPASAAPAQQAGAADEEPAEEIAPPVDETSASTEPSEPSEPSESPESSDVSELLDALDPDNEVDAPTDRQSVIPERPEPFTPPRQPEHHDAPAPAMARMSVTSSAGSSASTSGSSTSTAAVTGTPGHASGHGTVQGAHALQPDASYIERDPSVNKSLLLRLIAGVRGL